jgi:DNA mismatch endonuclease, patch repair protein
MKRRIFFLPYQQLHCIFSTAWAWDAVGGRQRRALTFVRIRLMDTLTPTERSKRMALIRGKNTKPELVVRKIARSFGHRLRLHVADLPGKPDLVFPKLRKIIFVHGCYWHRHPGCSLARLPKSKLRFWLPKLTENRRRDLRNVARLRRQNWSVSEVWECQLKNPLSLAKRMKRFLEGKNAKY